EHVPGALRGGHGTCGRRAGGAVELQLSTAGQSDESSVGAPWRIAEPQERHLGVRPVDFERDSRVPVWVRRGQCLLGICRAVRRGSLGGEARSEERRVGKGWW